MEKKNQLNQVKNKQIVPIFSAKTAFRVPLGIADKFQLI